MASFITKVLYLLPILLLQYNSIMAQSIAPLEPTSQSSFAGDLFSFIVEKKSTENICYSPASIHSSLALIYLGAAGHTAEELRKVLKLEQEDKSPFATKYGQFLKTIFKTTTTNDNMPQLKMATRLYVNNEIKISQQFNKLAQDNFQSEAENVDFSQSSTVVDKINKWVEQKTENKIRNLLQQDSLNGDASCVLVNAIYFKAEWLHPFSLSSTTKNDFHKNRNEKVRVDMMYTDDHFGYAELPNLKAKALEMPYKNSDISMLILLPDEIEDLENLEKGLREIDLNDITSKMIKQSIDVFLPKFRIEFNIDLKETLIKMGAPSMFTQNANLSNLFDSATPQKITNIEHKAFLDCNEAGSEAAAATYLKIVPMSINLDKKVFRANHPFVFVVRSKDAVYFAGHVANF